MTQSARFIFHPILLNKRSRFLFYWFLFLALTVGAMMWVQFNTFIKSAGLNLQYGPPTKNWVLALLLSNYVRVGVILLVALVAASLTAKHVTGPFKRVEEWLTDWKKGMELEPLRARQNDKFQRMIELINALYDTLNSPKKLPPE